MILQVGVTVSSLVSALQQWGFLDLVLPFILIFAIVFALLEQVGILGSGDEGRKYNMVVALAIGLLIVVPHALNPRPDDAVSIIQRYLPEFVFLTLALVLVILLLGLVSVSSATKGILTGALGLAAVAYLVLVIIGSVTRFSIPFAFLQDPNFVAIMVIILVFGAVVYYVAGPEKKTDWFGETEKWINALLGRK